MKKNILSVTSIRNKYSIALLQQSDNKKQVIECNNISFKKILIEIDRLLFSVKLKIKNLHAIFFSIGPSSFTEIRLTISMVFGISIKNNIPFFSFSNFEILAEKSWKKNKINSVNIFIQITKKKTYFAKCKRKKTGNWKKKKKIITIKKVENWLNKKKIKINVINFMWEKKFFLNFKILKKINLINIKKIYAKDIFFLLKKNQETYFSKNNMFLKKNINLKKYIKYLS